MTAITALLDFKIFPRITELLSRDSGGGIWKENILPKLWENITYEVQYLSISELDAYSQLSKLANQVFCTELYNEFKIKIYAYIYRRTSDQILSEELTANVFLKMLEAIEEDKTWTSSFSGWIYRIAHNKVIDYYRARDRQKGISFDEIPHFVDPENNPVKAAELAFDVDVLKSAMRRLTEEQAQVVELRFLQGYSFADIAETMDKTEGAVKALQHRAIETLRVLLKNDAYSF